MLLMHRRYPCHQADAPQLFWGTVHRITLAVGIVGCFTPGAIAQPALPSLEAAPVPPVAQPSLSAPSTPTTLTRPSGPATSSLSIPVSSGTAQAAQVSTQFLFVNPTTGQDHQDGRSWQSSLRTITQALAIAGPNSVIMLAPGTYSQTTGEQFPLVLDRAITLQGEPGRQGAGIVIEGGQLYATPADDQQHVAIVMMDQAALVGVTVINPAESGYSVWVADGQPLLMQNSLFPAQSVFVAQASQPTLMGNQTRDLASTAPASAIAPSDPARSAPINTPAPAVSIPVSLSPSSASSAAAFPSPSLPTSNLPTATAIAPMPAVAPQATSTYDWERNVTALTRSAQASAPAPVSLPVQAPPSQPPAPRILFTQRDTVGFQLETPSTARRTLTDGAAPEAIAQPSQLEISPELQAMLLRQTPIEIPVVAPEPGWTAAAVSLPAPVDVLPVPSMEIPIGNVGNLPRVQVDGSSSVSSYRASLPLRYRVLVDAEQPSQQNRVQSLVPGAFSTVVDGRSVMQAGAFNDMGNAQELVDLLTDYGFRAVLAPMN